jgi:hypothetical protein
MLAAASLLPAGALAQGPALEPDVAARELRACDATAPSPYGGRALWNPNLWTGGVVPYQFDANTNASEQAAMRAAMNALESVAAVHFVVRSNQANYLAIRDANGNNSQVGMVGGGQTVNIFNWDFQYIMCHELMHALGVWHEQSRSDRGDFVTINYGNISQTDCGGPCAYNFNIVSGDLIGPYDFDSVMHYDQFAFSSNGGPTITVLPPHQQWADLIGQSDHLSATDITGLVTGYQAAGPLAWVRKLPATSPTPRAAHAMAYDSARGVMVLFGGDAGSPNAETWEWNGTAWTQRVVTGPTGRLYHSMAYDSARGVTVLFGGQTVAGLNNETWEWNGTAWTRRMVPGPTARGAHSMAYDSARHVTVLFGGTTAPSIANAETWEWNGTAWTQKMVTGPTARRSHAMAYDPARGVCVLFGGVNGAGTTCNGETWEWNGTAWSHPAGDGPAPRAYHAMAYDSQRGFTILFAGTDTGQGGVLYSDVWERDASGWVQRSLGGPAPRSSPAMAYDGARHRPTMFGGSTGFPLYLNGETWIVGPPVCIAPTMGVTPGVVSVCVGGTATFSAGASGTGAGAYRWRREGVPVSNIAGHISGAFTPTMTIIHATAADEGSYDCLVANSCVAVSIGNAKLLLNSSDFDHNGDGGTDADIEAFFACLAGNCCATCGTADFNGDGDTGTDADIEAFFRVLAGGSC